MRSFVRAYVCVCVCSYVRVCVSFIRVTFRPSDRLPLTLRLYEENETAGASSAQVIPTTGTIVAALHLS